MTTQNISEHEQQAMDFLTKFGITFQALKSNTKSANWSPSGHHYVVTLRNNTTPPTRGVTFDFFGSIADKESGKDISAYDVLACCGSEINCPETYQDFLSEFGFDDEPKSRKTFRDLKNFSAKLKSFFTPEEIEALGEIN